MSANPYGRCNDESNRAAPPALTEVVTLESQPTVSCLLPLLATTVVYLAKSPSRKTLAGII